MNIDERRERGTKLCTRLTHEVATIAPPGIGAWPEAWEIVAEADAEFMLALASWEATGEKSALSDVSTAYDAVLAAWECAARAYLARAGTNEEDRPSVSETAADTNAETDDSDVIQGMTYDSRRTDGQDSGGDGIQ